MEENFYKDDFEKFLQDQVKHHRMFPSDRIWRNINNNLHKDYKWPALTIAAFAFIAATIAISVYFSPGPNIFSHDVQKSGSIKEVNSTASPLTSVLNNKRSIASLTPASSSLASLSNENTPVTDEVETQPQPNVLSRVVSTFSNNEFAESRVLAIQLSKEEVSLKELNALLQKSAVDELYNSRIVFDKEQIAVPDTKEILQGGNAQPKNLKTDLSIAGKNKKQYKQSRLSYQVYITPSASYRKLTEDRSTTIHQASNVGGPVGISYVSEVNQVVRHKPGTGMEAGVSFGYSLSNKLRIKTGLQLNARQYTIQAYISNREFATIAYNSGRGIDSLTAFSSYRTSNGSEATDLTNRYYQISMPLGIEYEVAGNKNIQLNVAAAIQPTYMLSKNAFLISTDFKNYIESPGMTRSWNLNASVETFLSIKSGTYKWQVGPQFRYQTLPTSVKEYPIREYLMDYGLKIGVSKKLQ